MPSRHLNVEETRLMLHTLADMLLVFSPDGSLLAVEGCSDKLQQPKQSAQLLGCIHTSHRYAALRTFLAIVRGRGKQRVKFRWEGSGGASIWLDASAVPVYRSDGALEKIVVALIDITDSMTMEQGLRALAFHDSLTGVPNRLLFMEHLKHSIHQARRSRGTLAILHLDIDDFKEVNDTYGHDAGDELLNAFTHRLRRCVREMDVFARIGGDEFTILLPSIESAECVNVVAERIYRALASPLEVAAGMLSVQVSTGIAVFPEHGEDASVLLKNADIALYEAKRRGKNLYVFYRHGMRFSSSRPR